MDKLKKSQIILFVLSIAVMFILNGFKQENTYDRYFIKVNLDTQRKQEIIIDVGKQGVLKRLLQPNKMTVYLTCKTNAKNLSCSVENVDYIISQNSKKGSWKELPSNTILKKFHGEVPLSMEFTLPSKELEQYSVDDGILRFYSDSNIYHEIWFKFINSKHKM